MEWLLDDFDEIFYLLLKHFLHVSHFLKYTPINSHTSALLYWNIYTPTYSLFDYLTKPRR